MTSDVRYITGSQTLLEHNLPCNFAKTAPRTQNGLCSCSQLRTYFKSPHARRGSVTPVFRPSAGSQTLLEQIPILFSLRKFVTSSSVQSAIRPSHAHRESVTPVFYSSAGSQTLRERKLILSTLRKFVTSSSVQSAIRPSHARRGSVTPVFHPSAGSQTLREHNLTSNYAKTAPRSQNGLCFCSQLRTLFKPTHARRGSVTPVFHPSAGSQTLREHNLTSNNAKTAPRS